MNDEPGRQNTNAAVVTSSRASKCWRSFLLLHANAGRDWSVAEVTGRVHMADDLVTHALAIAQHAPPHPQLAAAAGPAEYSATRPAHRTSADAADELVARLRGTPRGRAEHHEHQRHRAPAVRGAQRVCRRLHSGRQAQRWLKSSTSCARPRRSCAPCCCSGAIAASRAKLLFWSSLCFVGLAVNNVMLILDLYVVSTDLFYARTARGGRRDGHAHLRADLELAMKEFLWGLLAMASAVASLLFLRYGKVTRDRLFLYFSAAFLAMTFNWIGLADDRAGHRASVIVAYTLRLLAFVLILIGIIDKNRARAARASESAINGRAERGGTCR